MIMPCRQQYQYWGGKTSMKFFFFFFLSSNLLIGWQLSIWNCCKPLFSLLYNCQLPCFWRLAKYRSRGLPTAFFPDVAPSRMFTTNSLCLIVYPIHEWHLICKIFKSNHFSFALWKTSSFVILSVHFIFTILQQHVYYKLVMSNCVPYAWVAYIF
jgi:hypothetical protein